MVALYLAFLFLAPLFLYFLLFNSASEKANKQAQLPLPPGPPAWPIVGNLPHLGPKPHQTLQSLSRAYGPLLHLRLGRVDAVVASSACAAEALLKTHDALCSSRPANAGSKHMAYDGRDLVWAPYGPRWRALRKASNLHLFSARALDDSRHIRHSEVAGMVDGIARSATVGPVEVGHWVSACVANSLSRAMLGWRVFPEGRGKGEVREFMEMVVELTTLAGEFVVGDFVPGLGWLDIGRVVGRMKRLAGRFDVFLDRVIKEHLEEYKGEEKKDLLSVLIGLKEEEAQEGLTDDDIKGTLSDMFVAGTDTSSSTVEWALTELIRHPDILGRVQAELDSVVGRDRHVSELDFPSLPLLQAVVKETLRLHPPTPLSVPRIAAADLEINGYRIPKNTTLMVNVWAIGRDPASWSDPLEFKPDRFLPGGERPNVDVKGNDFELIPFGAGRRICAGMGMGLRMVQLLTATLAQSFDWALPMGQGPEDLDMEEAYGITLQKAVPLAACPKPRLVPHVYGPSAPWRSNGLLKALVSGLGESG